METLTVTPFQFSMKPTHKPYMPSHHSNATTATSSVRTPSAAATVMDFGGVSTKMTIHNAARSELLCRYPSKLCDNRRSEKRGGGLHRFCAFHRERANINQRRVDHRRRLRRRGGVVAPTEKEFHSSDDENSHAEDMVSLDSDAFDFEDACIPLYSALTEDDLQVLIALLDEPSNNQHACDAARSIAIKQEPLSESV